MQNTHWENAKHVPVKKYAKKVERIQFSVAYNPKTQNT